MNFKRFIGIIILILGVLLIIYAINLTQRSDASTFHEATTKTGHMFTESVRNMMHANAQEDTPQDRKVMWMLIGGLVLFFVGAGMGIFCGTKKVKKA